MNSRTGIAAAVVLAIAVATAPAATAAPEVIPAITAAGGACGPLDSHGENECVIYDTGFKLVPGEALAQSAQIRRLGCLTNKVTAAKLILTNGHWFITTPVNAELGLIQSALAAQGVSAAIQSFCP